MSQNKYLTAGRRQPGIRRKFFFYMMLFILILLGLLWLFQVVLFGEIYKAVRTREITVSADAIARSVSDGGSGLTSITRQIAAERQVCVLVFDANGNVLASENSFSDCIIHDMTSKSIYKLYTFAKENGGEKLSRFRMDVFKNTLYDADFLKESGSSVKLSLDESIIFTKVVSGGSWGSDIVVMLNTTVSPVDSTVRTLQTELIIITAVMIAAAALISLVLAGRISKPIISINSGAKRLAGGDYSCRFTAGGYREIAELSDTLNYAAEELSKTGALQRELISNISHDLRTPLTMITGYAEVMRDIPGENTPENLQIIIDEAKRLSSLVSDVLDISKLQSGTQELTLTDFNLTETVREVIGRFSKLTEQDGWTIDFVYDHEVTVNADRTRILQVIYNFINNAITHTDNDRRVEVIQRVITDAEGKMRVRIEVKDHGEGIPEESIPYIFDRYYRTDKTHRRARQGSGLGLSVVKSILELHGAKYGVDSQLGVGSCFWFEL